MRRSAVLIALVLVVLAGVCMRLGVWQLARWSEKRVLEATQRAMLAAPPLALDDPLATPASRVAGRMVTVRGTWDTTRVVLITGRVHDGMPGVEWVRPLRVRDGELMVVRGWLDADDGVHPRLADRCDDAEVTLRGIAEPMKRGAGDVAPVPLARARGFYTTRWLDADSLARVVPARLADWSLRVMPGKSESGAPMPLLPEPIDPRMHLSYAIQWFVFAFVALAAAFVVMRRSAPARVTLP